MCIRKSQRTFLFSQNRAVIYLVKYLSEMVARRKDPECGSGKQCGPFRDVPLGAAQSQVVLLQTAHSWANAGVLLGARMHRERGSFRNN